MAQQNQRQQHAAQTGTRNLPPNKQQTLTQAVVTSVGTACGSAKSAPAARRSPRQPTSHLPLLPLLLLLLLARLQPPPSACVCVRVCVCLCVHVCMCVCVCVHFVHVKEEDPSLSKYRSGHVKRMSFFTVNVHTCMLLLSQPNANANPICIVIQRTDSQVHLVNVCAICFWFLWHLVGVETCRTLL